jgi:putative ABC transport system substrate-binding protein
MGQTGRRQFLIATGALLATRMARAQQEKRVYRIALPALTSYRGLESLIAALEQGLRELGYLPGKDIVLEFHSAEGKPERLPEVMKEAVRSKPDVIITGPNAVTTAAQAATQSIPIVMTAGTEVIDAGYARSFARPGGNITGMTVEFQKGATGFKRIELLKEIAPSISLVAFLWDAPYDGFKTVFDAAAPARGMRTYWHEFSGEPEQDFAEMTRRGADAVFAIGGGPQIARRTEIATLAIKHRLPISYSASLFVEAGALMSYGPNFLSMFRAAARHVDKILKGIKPGDIPIEQATVFDLVINLKTAKALGLTIPPSIMLRANSVID